MTPGKCWSSQSFTAGRDFSRYERKMEMEDKWDQYILSPSMQPATKAQTPLSEGYLNTVGHQLRKLSRAFRRELDEQEILTYLEQLRDLAPEKIELACTRALQTLKRMPLIADIRELASEHSDTAHAAPSYGKHCARCQPDGWVKETHPIHGSPFKVVRRCDCQGENQ
jgi:hypothetical protein